MQLYANTCSIWTAFTMIFLTVASDGLFTKCLNIKQAKSQWRPWKAKNEIKFRSLFFNIIQKCYHSCQCIPPASSLLMSSLEKVSPGIRPLFFSQKIAAKEPEKNIPSTAAKATTRSPAHKIVNIKTWPISLNNSMHFSKFKMPFIYDLHWNVLKKRQCFLTQSHFINTSQMEALVWYQSNKWRLIAT